MKKALTLFVALIATGTLWAGNVITYTSAYKLREVENLIAIGYDIHTKGFDVDIANHTFSNGVGTITFASDITSIPTHMFYYSYYITSVTIPEGVTSIDSRAFQFCSNLTTVNLPSTLTTIGYSAFSDCTSLSNITIPDSLTTISDYAFYNCPSLTSFTIPQNVTSLGKYVFASCSSLDSIYIPASVSSIGYEAFINCDGLTSIIVDSGNITYDSRDSCNAIIYTATDSLISGCQNTIIPEGITRIGSFAFYYLSELTSINIPNSVIAIGKGAFSNTGLTTITIPESVTSIDLYAFDDCTALSSITCLAETPPTIPVKKYSSDAYFKNIDRDIPVYIPCGSIRRYQNANGWSVFNNFQQPEICILDISVTSENTTMGSVSGSDSIQYLDTAIISASANYGYHFTQWNDGVTDNPREVVMLSDTAFTALFAKNSYNLSVLPKLIDGTVPGHVSGRGTFHYLDTIQISATPIYGYHFAQWSNGELTNPANVVLTNDTTIYAQFEKNTYTISGTAINGQIQGLGDHLYLDSISLLAVADTNYHFLQWSDGNTDNPRQIQVIGDLAYEAIFQGDFYTISVTSEYGSVNGTGLFEYNTTTTLKVTSDYGYHFAQWNDGVMDSIRVVTVLSDSLFTAIYDRNSYTLDMSANDPKAGTITGADTYLYLDTITIEATPSVGFQFNQWSDGDTTNPRQLIITSDILLVAEFGIKQCILTLGANNETWGLVAGDGVYDYKKVVACTAMAMPGYEFVKWSDGSTNNPYLFEITDDTTMIAEFAEIPQGLNTNMFNQVPAKLILNGVLYIRRGDSLYDVQGRMLK